MQVRIWPILSFAFACCSILFGNSAHAITFADGLTHTIDAGNSYPFESVVVRDGAGAVPTTLNLVSGGMIGTGNGNPLTTYNHSVVKISGGQWGATAGFFDSSIVSVTGGSPGTMVAAGSSTLTFSGGTTDFLGGNTNSSITVLGGTIDRLFIEGASVATLYAGTITGNVGFAIETRGTTHLSIFGGGFPSLVSIDQSTVEIIGSGFNLPLGNITALSGTLTGSLSDGTPLNISFGRASTATITLVPEPNTGLLVMTGILGLAAWRRRSA